MYFCIPLARTPCICTPSDTTISYFIDILILVTSFGRTGYHQATNYKKIQIDISVLHAPAFLCFLYIYWPNDGLLRPKLVTNSRLTIKYYIVVSEGVHI